MSENKLFIIALSIEIFHKGVSSLMRINSTYLYMDA